MTTIETNTKADKKQSEFWMNALRIVSPIGWLAVKAYTDDKYLEHSFGGINAAAKDTVRDTFYLLHRIHENSQDANADAADIDEWWNEHITKNIGLGEYDFRMAIGWKIPAGTIYNGAPSEAKTIDSKTAVFIKYKNGDVEVMDRDDPRYGDVVLPYVAASLFGPSALAKGAGMVATKLSKMSQFTRLEESAKAAQALNDIHSSVKQAGKYAPAALGVTNGAGMVVDVVTAVAHELFLKPEATTRMAHLFDHPSKMDAKQLREDLNIIFEEYSYKNGPNSSQYYVRPLRDSDNPVYRMQEISQGVLKNALKYDNPFDKNPEKLDTMTMVDVRDHVKKDPYFQKGFFSLVDKALRSADMNEQEIVMLRFGMGIYFEPDGNNRSSLKAGDFIVDKQGKPFSLEETKGHLINFFKEFDDVDVNDLGQYVRGELSKSSVKVAELDKEKAALPSLSAPPTDNVPAGWGG